MKMLGRVIKFLFASYPALIPIVIVCILFAAGVASIPSIFQQKVLEVIVLHLEAGSTDWQSALTEILPLIGILIALYFTSIVLITVQTQLMAYITQGFLTKLRRKMFDGMQNLPIKYFDTHKHGDIMSHYTNDIDTLRQLVSQSLPSLLQAGVVVCSVLFIMLWYSVWMTLVVLAGVVAMVFVTRFVGGGSAKYFIRQQKAVGKTEGYIQEMMNGQKVVKVFCHEEKSKEEFDKINNDLFEDAYRAHSYANMMGPIIGNIGNIRYVLIATVGGLFLLLGTKNLAISGLAFSIDIVVPFLNMTKQFTGNVNQVAQQFNQVAMGLAGAERVFKLMDQEPETDEGYVTLVNVTV
ncbi:MAG: ABC transporter ATP-binding protein, partial [Clostridia bacterium]|nr:ABC transporter ATP-binding protein [Clostridia bacterium]